MFKSSSTEFLQKCIDEVVVFKNLAKISSIIIIFDNVSISVNLSFLLGEFRALEYK
jgi:hypothetical protein